MDFSHSWWWIFLLLYAWLKYVQREQKKRTAQQEAAKKKAEALRKTIEQSPEGTSSVLAEEERQTEGLQEEDNLQYDAKMYSFESPITEEEKEDQAAREAAYKFVPAETEGETSREVADEYAFKTAGDFPAFMMPKEQIQIGEYFPQGLQQPGQTYLSPEDIRRSIITMEILLPPRCKRLTRR